MTLLQPICPTPTIFPNHPDVCNGCGHLLSEHSIKPTGREAERRHQVKAALWAVMVRLGGFHNQYDGGINLPKSEKMRRHVLSCGLDLDRMDEPVMDSVDLFTDTFSDPEMVQMMVGRMYCRCGDFQHVEIVLPDLTFGQLVWHSLHTEPIGA